MSNFYERRQWSEDRCCWEYLRVPVNELEAQNEILHLRALLAESQKTCIALEKELIKAERAGMEKVVAILERKPLGYVTREMRTAIARVRAAMPTE